MVLQELFTIARQSEAQRKPFGPLEKLYAQGDGIFYPTKGCQDDFGHVHVLMIR